MPDVETKQPSVRDLIKQLDDLEIQRNKPELNHDREQLDDQIKNVVEKLHDLRDVVGIVLQRTIDLRIHLTQQLGGMKELEVKTSADLTKALRASREALGNVVQDAKVATPVKQQERAPEQEQEAEERPSPKPYKNP